MKFKLCKDTWINEKDNTEKEVWYWKTDDEQWIPISKMHLLLVDVDHKIISQDDLEEIKNTPFDDLIMLHTSLGRWIRNQCGLWFLACLKPASEVDGMSPDHPDNASFTVIENLWCYLNECEKPTTTFESISFNTIQS